MNFLKSLKEGIITNNPVFIQFIGMCPTLGVTTSLENGFSMGLATTAVLICSNVVISAIRKYIPSKIRIAAFITIIAGFVTVIDLIIQGFLPELSNSLGLFIPLIVVNCLILARAEAFASKNPILPSIVDAISMGLGFTFALSTLGLIREILGNGTILGVELFGPNFMPATLMIMPAGAFLALGFIVAVVQKFTSKKGA